MEVVIVSSEVAPFSKTGGLGDVTAALSSALHRAGHRVMTVSPRYGVTPLDGLKDSGHVARAYLGTSEQTAKLLVHTAKGPTHVLVEHPMFADRAGIYGDQNGSFGDNHIRFALLQRAGLEAARRIPVGRKTLGESPIFHVHDWQTASLPVYLDQVYRPLGFFRDSPVVLTLHNPAHQGRLPAKMFDDLDLPQRWFSPHGLEWHGDLALLKCGVLRADQLTTVSPTFAWEITTAAGGFGLDVLFRGRFAELTGILNGIDTTEWDPTSDPHLDAPFSAGDPTGKATCKAGLQAELGLPMEKSRPLVGSVGRIDPQKGTELLIDSIPWLVDQGAQVVVLGSAHAAHQKLEWRLREMEDAYPDRVRAWIGFDERIAHRIEAAADIFAMPSLFEPCGLNQMYSMRYGAVPVVRATGGLADSVQDGVTGFSFVEPTGFAFRGALHRALKQFAADGLAAMRAEGMSRDFGWDAVVPEYEAVYAAAVEGRARLLRA
ncbi:MAG: glycogen synthase [Alphaproteobacteria bacterium]|nr:glycogen synthase [Alphaproteobacteria bacterium]